MILLKGQSGRSVSFLGLECFLLHGFSDVLAVFIKVTLLCLSHDFLIEFS